MHYFAAARNLEGRLLEGKRYFMDENGDITLENGERVSAISWQMKDFLKFVDYYGGEPKEKLNLNENSKVNLTIFQIIRGKEVILPIGDGIEVEAEVIEHHKKKNGDLILLAKIPNEDEPVEINIPNDWMP